MLFMLPWKLFLFLRCLNFCPDFFGYVEKWLDKKDLVNFEISDIINWETNNSNTHIAQFPKIPWEIFFWKNRAQNVVEKSFRLFSKKSKLVISLNQQLEISYSLFVLLHTKHLSGSSLSVSFLAWFLKENISHVKFY